MTDLTPPEVLVMLRDAEAVEPDPARKKRLRDVMLRLMHTAHREMVLQQRVGIRPATDPPRLQFYPADDAGNPDVLNELLAAVDARFAVQAEAERELGLDELEQEGA
jgi:hypothetical protein